MAYIRNDLDTENIKDLNLAVVRLKIAYVVELVLRPEQTFMGHNLLHRAWIERGLIHA
jgi:hypothetical protein